MTVLVNIALILAIIVGIMAILFLGFLIVADMVGIYDEIRKNKIREFNNLFLKTKRLCPEAVEMVRGSSGSAGMDLTAIDTKTIMPQGKEVFRTGWAMEIPQGSVGLIFARSGLSTKAGIRPTTCVSVIDSDYRGEVMIGLYNDGDKPYTINAGDRIAQLVIIEYKALLQLPAKELSETNRGEGGFGSTGRK